MAANTRDPSGDPGGSALQLSATSETPTLLGNLCKGAEISAEILFADSVPKTSPIGLKLSGIGEHILAHNPSKAQQNPITGRTSTTARTMAVLDVQNTPNGNAQGVPKSQPFGLKLSGIVEDIKAPLPSKGQLNPTTGRTSATVGTMGSQNVQNAQNENANGDAQRSPIGLKLTQDGANTQAHLPSKFQPNPSTPHLSAAVGSFGAPRSQPTLSKLAEGNRGHGSRDPADQVTRRTGATQDFAQRIHSKVQRLQPIMSEHSDTLKEFYGNRQWEMNAMGLLVPKSGKHYGDERDRAADETDGLRAYNDEILRTELGEHNRFYTDEQTGALVER